MGSEAPQACVLHVTGFKKFYGVDENPTEVIALALQEYLEKKGLPPGMRLGSITVLESAGDGALPDLLALFESALVPDTSTFGMESPSVANEKIIWLHMGVNSGASKFAVERKAINEATFRCPDELGWQPQRVPIVAVDGDIFHTRETDVPVLELVDVLVKKGHNVVASDDAGRFVCNYVYYHSLRHAASRGTRCLFVHFPPFRKIQGEKQLEFLASLVEGLVALC